MNKNYRQLTESIQRRINPDNIILAKAFSDELSTISYSDVLTYIRMAMKGVEPEYTERSIDAGNRVKEHLKKELTQVSFRYQGSVMTNTHIKGNSDIDLLTICEKFYQYDSSSVKNILEDSTVRTTYNQSSINKLLNEENISSYKGDSMSDLQKMRLNSETILTKIYKEIDITKPKAIKIKNLSLNREVDIVIANWYDDVNSIINDKGENRGIQIYNKETNSKEKPDYPFVSIARINERSSLTKGRLKKMIRFLKNIKASSDQDIILSSFDINAICYDIEINVYKDLSFYELVPVVYYQIKKICERQIVSDNIVSVDGKEWIFRNDNKKLESLKIVMEEVEGVMVDLKSVIEK